MAAALTGEAGRWHTQRQSSVRMTPKSSIQLYLASIQVGSPGLQSSDSRSAFARCAPPMRRRSERDIKRAPPS